MIALQNPQFSAMKERAERVLVTPRPALTLTRKDRAMVSLKICSVDGCGKPVRARGWCCNHYALWERNGAPEYQARTIKMCSVAGCQNKRAGLHGYCGKHGYRFRKHGDPLKLAPRHVPPTECSIDGCGNAANGKRGMCNAHYLKWYRRGDPLALSLRADNGEPERWLRDHVGYSGDECLTWPFATGRDGRGRITSEIAPQAHRAMCILRHGPPPSPIHEAAHSCGKGHEACVNPNHLYWATPVENAADRTRHGTECRGEACHNAKLTRSQVREIRRLKGCASQAQIGAMFGVDAETVGSIHRRETWAWLK